MGVPLTALAYAETVGSVKDVSLVSLLSVVHKCMVGGKILVWVGRPMRGLKFSCPPVLPPPAEVADTETHNLAPIKFPSRCCCNWRI